MKEEGILKDLNSDIMKNAVKLFPHGVVIAEKRSWKVVYASEDVYPFFPGTDNLKGKKLPELVDSFETDNLSEGNDKVKLGQVAGNAIYARVIVENSSHIVLVMEDETRFENLEKENKYLRSLIRQLQEVYEGYNYDTLCITDDKGIIEFSGASHERMCGISHTDVIGRSVYDLAKEQYFYPSVTAKIIETHQSEVIMQDTRIGNKLFTIGVPIFDEEGNLYKVISISRDFSQEIEIAKTIIAANVKSETEETRENESKIVTCSEITYEIMDFMKRAAKSKATILIEGETGTGKSLFATYIHKTSDRRDNPFIAVNCGAIPENLIESELFGYEQCAFTGADKKGKAGLLEMAQGGTIFLDEIGELPLQQQVKLLHVLQEKALRRIGGRKQIALDVRVIAATNKDLVSLVKKGEFREDLYYRLNVISFRVPSLRERKEDVPLLISHFINKYNLENDEQKEISKEAINYLQGYDWPGNIRELENLMEAMCVIAPETVIDVKLLPEKIFSSSEGKEKYGKSLLINDIVSLKEATEEMEKQLLSKAMKRCKGNQKEIANLLGVDRSTITRKLNAYKIKYTEKESSK